MPDQALEAKMQERNQIIEQYDNKWNAYQEIKEKLESLMPREVSSWDSTLEEVDSLLDELDELFVEIGWISEEGKFDAESYRIMQVDRQIARGAIQRMEQLPLDLREHYKDAYDADASSFDREAFETSSSLREQIREVQDTLSEHISEDWHFSHYISQNGKVSPEMASRIEELDALWPEYAQAVKDAAYFLNGQLA